MLLYLRHRELALESPPNSVVNTFRLAPGLLHAMVSVGLMAPVKILLLNDSDYTR